MSSVMIDGVILILFSVIVLNYTLKGFFSSLVGFIRFWVASGVATLFSPLLGEVLQPLFSEKLGGSGDGGFFSGLLDQVISSGYLARAFAFILIFVIVILVIKLIEIFANLMARRPVIGFLNRTLGCAIGIVIAFFWVELAAFAMVSLSELVGEGFALFSKEALEHTVLTKWLYEHNIFSWIMECLLGRLA